ncbi:MAG: glycosyltransferase [Pseudomonadota bacterium]|nr:glycosyltransferase [Pseudomonadota bacterium]
MEVDLVYLWCSNTQPDFKKKLQQTENNFFISNNKFRPNTRFSDHNELRYSLRSVEKFAPWIHHIYIVTDNQVPEWLNLEHPKITLVDHREIIPEAYLPTFNSNVIEAFIHQIPNLCEKFLFANDDMFFTNDTDPSFFFTDDGRPIHRPHPTPDYRKDYYAHILKQAKTLAEKDTGRSVPMKYPYPSHNIDPYTKSLYADTFYHFLPYYEKMFPNKFRRLNDVQRFLVSCWGLLTDRLVWDEKDIRELRFIDQCNEQILNDFLSKEKPKLFCINDTDILRTEDYLSQSKLLQNLFPNKSSFEKDDEIVAMDYQSFSLKPAFSQKNIPVVFLINEAFIPFLGITLASLLKNIQKKYNYDIIILENGGNPFSYETLIPKKLPKNVSIRIQDIGFIGEKYKRGPFKTFTHEKITKWLRIFLPQFLNNYSKIIYLDSDLLIHCDVAELYQLELNGMAIGGIVDMEAHNLLNSKKESMNRVFHCTTIDDYINLGVMVMDLDILRRFNFDQRVMKLMTIIPEKFWNFNDFFNALLHNNTTLLDMTYNFQYGLLLKAHNLYSFFQDEYYLPFQKVKKEGAKITHFTTVKPWHKIIENEGINWWKLARETPFYEMALSIPKGIPVPPKIEKGK